MSQRLVQCRFVRQPVFEHDFIGHPAMTVFDEQFQFLTANNFEWRLARCGKRLEVGRQQLQVRFSWPGRG